MNESTRCVFTAIVFMLVVLGLIGIAFLLNPSDEKVGALPTLELKGPYYKLIEKQAPVEKGETHYYLFFKNVIRSAVTNGEEWKFSFHEDKSGVNIYKAETNLDTYVLFEKGRVYSAKEMPLIEIVDTLKPLPLKAEKDEK